jgi:hypothetical protein
MNNCTSEGSAMYGREDRLSNSCSIRTSYASSSATRDHPRSSIHLPTIFQSITLPEPTCVTVSRSCPFVTLVPSNCGFPKRVNACPNTVSHDDGFADDPIFKSKRSVKVKPRVENVRVNPAVLHLPVVRFYRPIISILHLDNARRGGGSPPM